MPRGPASPRYPSPQPGRMQMPFDPKVQAIHDRLERERVPNLYTLSIADARAADLRATMAGAGQEEPVASVTDRTIPGPAGLQPVRVYQPGGEVPRPVLVYFFGGGWSLGTLDTCDGACRMLTNAAGCVTVAVSYRLAPGWPRTRPSWAVTRTGWRWAGTAPAGTWPPRSPSSPGTGAVPSSRTSCSSTRTPTTRRAPRPCGRSTTRTSSTPRPSSGTGGFTWPDRRTAPTRWPRRCGRWTWAGCRSPR